MTDYTLITGASSGIGEAFAVIAAREGRNVIITARRKERLETLAHRLDSEGAGEVHVIAADLAVPEDRERLWAEATAFGTIDIFVNNAGLGTHGPFAENDWDREAQSIDVNVTALTWLMKQAVSHMSDKPRGRILNVASVASFLPGPNMAVYHATKAYVLSLSEAVAEELGGTGISVTALCPGATESEFQDGADMQDVTFIKNQKLPSSMGVARDGWSGMKAGTRVVLPGAMNKISAMSGRLLPRFLTLKATKYAMSKDNGDTAMKRARSAADQAGEQAREAAGQARAQAKETAETVRKKAAGFKAQVLDPDSDFANTMRKKASEWRTRAHIRGESATSGLSPDAQATTTGANNGEGTHEMDQKQAEQMRSGDGFVAALDQSGGSTPKALRLYGIEEDQYSSEDQMFDMIHDMRARIVKAPAFTGEKVIGAILFEMTMDREFEGKPAAAYLWEDKGVVPFLKCDKGLEDEANGVQLMKPMGDLDGLLTRAKSKGIFGTKMRSVINAANTEGIAANAAQQFEIGKQILGHGLMPILEPEVNIKISDKAEAEKILRDEIMKQLDAMDREVMLKLSLPSEDGFYSDVIAHKNVMRVVALSGGYSREEANDLLARNPGMTASFSRALTEGLSAQQSDDEFNAMIASTIDSIYRASIT